MRNINFLKLLGGIDDKYIEQADEDFDPNDDLYGYYVVEEYHGKFAWKTALTSVACTAVVLCTLFFVSLKNGVIEFINAPASSENSNSNISIDDGFIKLKDFEGIPIDLQYEDLSGITVDSLFAFEENSNKITRYDAGKMFGDDIELLDAKALFSNDGDGFRISKQEFIINHATNLMTSGYSFNGKTMEFQIDGSLFDQLGLPCPVKNIDDFKTQLLYDSEVDLSGNEFHGKINYCIYLMITIDYSAKSIECHADGVFWF